MENEKEVIKKESEIIEVVPKFEISINEAGNRFHQLQQFIKSQMKDGTDFGKIPGINKPTLFKSGAEKLENIHGFYHKLYCIDKVEDFEKGFFFYRYKCSVYHKKNNILQSECIGSCNNKENKYLKADAYTIINTIDKMAQKRAFVGAIINACRISSDFTQDVEDMDIKNLEGDVHVCVGCGVQISDKVLSYSVDKFGKVLCVACQKKEGGGK